MAQHPAAAAAAFPEELTANPSASSDYCGRSVATGDFNGDAKADVAVGCSGTAVSGFLNSGAVLIYLRKADNTGWEVPVQLARAVTVAGDYCAGYRQIDAGDVNGDGRDDVVMGCTDADVAAAGAGLVTVFTRNSGNTGFDAPVDLTSVDMLSYDECGTSVAVADVNGDGRDDIAAGCPLADPSTLTSAGRTVMFVRNVGNTGFDATAYVAPSPVASDYCGTSVALGDVNGDLRADLVIGCYGLDPGGVSMAGGAYVWLRNAANTNFDAPTVVTRGTPTTSNQCAKDVEVGDLNGSGTDDIVLACPNAAVGSITTAGVAAVLLRDGGNTGFVAEAELSRSRPASGDLCDMLAIADRDGDGREDVLVGCSDADPANINAAGAALLFRRNSTNDGFIQERAVAPSPKDLDYCGSSVALGNLDGSADGTGEVVLGCFRRASLEGAAIVGVAQDQTAPPAPQLAYPQSGSTSPFNPNFHVGYSDDQAPGYAQVEVCSDSACTSVLRSGSTDGAASGATAAWGPTQVGDGAVYWRARAIDASDNVSAWTSTSPFTVAHAEQMVARATPASSDYCGKALGVGDVNGDARGDVLLGCYGGAVSGITDAGLGILAARNATNTGFDAGYELVRTSPVASDYCGDMQSVSSGDVNGDGRDDVVVGCRYFEQGGLNAAGALDVHVRNATNNGFEAPVTLARASPVASDFCGHATATGDFNGDGRDDVVFSCNYADPSGSTQSGLIAVALRNAGNTGFDTPVELARSTLYTYDYCGDHVATGDFNADGRDDIVMSCGKTDGTTSYGAFPIFLRNTGNTGFDQVVHLPDVTTNESCDALAVADVDGDIRDDLVIGCAGYDVNAVSNAGAALVYRRNAANTGFEPVEVVHRSSVDATGEQCGWGIASGDVDGDGRSDVLLGCTAADMDGLTDVGLAAVVRRNAVNTGWEPSIDVTTPTGVASSKCGRSVAAIDVNGDGRADPILGCEFWTVSGLLNAGAAWVVASPDFAASPAPTAPTALAQYRADGTTAIATGAWTTDGASTNVVLKFTVSDPEASQTLTPWVEYRPNGTAFGGTCGTAEAGAVVSGATVTITNANDVAAATVAITGLTSGTTYVWRACAVDQSANAGTWTSHGGTPDFGVDTAAPTVPTLVAPSDGASVSVRPLTATYGDTAPGSPGRLDFQVCSDATCTTVLESGASSGAIASGSNGSWSHSQPGGTYYWRARSVDGTGATSGWSGTWSFTLTTPPATTLLTPAAGGWTTSRTPALSASQTDPDGQAARMEFEVCATNTAEPWSTNCGATYERVDAASVASGGTGSVTLNEPLADGAWFWRARGIDTGGAIGAWAGPNALNVDATAPTIPTNVSASPSGRGAITLSWNASTDAGYGAVTYDAAVSADGITWTVICTDITTTSCRETGLGGVEYRFMRVVACDGLNNCTAWVGTIGSVGVGYNLRTSANSTLLTGADFRAATLASGTANPNTGIENADATGWFQFLPATLSTASLGSEPADTPNAAGWVVDDVVGKTLGAGGWEMVLQVTSGFATGTGRLQCRAWTVTTSGGAIASSTFLAKYTSPTDVLISGTSTITCPLPGFATQRSFAANEAIYVEAWLDVPTAGHADSIVTLDADGTSSYLVLPGMGVGPNVPSTPFSPTGTTGLTGVSLSATYSHPVPRDGAIEFQLFADSAMTTLIGQGTSSKLVSGTVGSWAAPDLNAATQYWWRARAIDTKGVSSGWSVTQTFSTSIAPATPTGTAPTGTISSTSPSFTSSAFSDADAGDTHGASQWQLRTEYGSYATPVADSGITTTELTSWAPALTLADGATYRWRVRHRDSFGVWSAWSAQPAFTVSTSGSTVSISVDSTSASLGALLPTVDAVGSSVVDVTTDAAGGYTLTASDSSDTAGAACACGGAIPDWTGTGATPTTWAAGTAGYAGVTVRDATGGRLAKWGTGTGTAATDFTANLFAGLPQTTSVTMHSSTAAAVGSKVYATYRANPASTTPPGTYQTTVAYSAVANP